MSKRKSRKYNPPPETLIHIGEKKAEDVKITIIDYDETHFLEKEAEAIEECFTFRDKPTVTWINVNGLHRTDILEKLGNYYGLHPLILEDILNTNQRPKTEDFGNYIFVVLKVMFPGHNNGEMTKEQISLILGTNFVISFQEGIAKEDIFEAIRERIETGKGRIRKMGADYLAYSLLDAIVDNYFIILENLEEKIEKLEEELVTNSKPETIQMINNLKKEIIHLYKSVWPAREILNSLDRGESPLIKESTGIYLRDVYDHATQVIETT